MFSSILMPTDGSACSEAAIRQGLDLAKGLGATVTFLYVVEDPTRNLWLNPEMPYVPELLKSIEDAGKAALERALAMAAEKGLEADSKQVLAKPVDGILEESRQHDLVVMGTHGRSGIDKLLLGSVTDGVLHRSQKPVVVIRSK